jgi:phosphatidylglycerophosphate synthase
MFLDSLDGSYARLSKQSSELGEILDHGFDAFNVQMICAGLAISLGFPIYMLVLSQLISSYIYNAQIVIYRVKGKMVNPPTNGVDAEIGAILLHLLAAFLREYKIIVMMIAIGANLTQLYDWMFFLAHFPPKEKNFYLHLGMVGISIPFGLLLIFEFINAFVFTILYGIICLKITGMLVLYTVAQKKIKSSLKGTKILLQEQQWILIFSWAGFVIFCFAQWAGYMYISAFSAYYLYEMITESIRVVKIMKGTTTKSLAN